METNLGLSFSLNRITEKQNFLCTDLEVLVKIPETRRVLALMNAVRESGRTGKSIDFE